MSKLNRLVATKVFGWTVNRDFSPPRWNVPLAQTEYYHDYDRQTSNHSNVPNFQGNIFDAMQVFDRLRRGKIHKDTVLGEAAYMVDTPTHEAHGENLCQVICILALRQFGVPETEIQEALR